MHWPWLEGLHHLPEDRISGDHADVGQYVSTCRNWIFTGFTVLRVKFLGKFFLNGSFCSLAVIPPKNKNYEHANANKHSSITPTKV